MGAKLQRRSIVPRLTVIALVALALAGIAPVAVGGNPADFDVRGTWTTSTRNDGDPTRYERTLVITEQSGSGDVKGTWDQHGAGATARMTGTVTGSKMRLVNRQNGSVAYVYNGTLATRNGALEWSGRWESPLGFGGEFTARRTTGPGPSPSPAPSDGRRKSASMVICNRDMAAATEDTVLRCTATVTDASGQPGSTAPTGTFAWTTTQGTLSQSTCGLVTGQSSTARCFVTLTAAPGVIPIATAPPVTASYPGDVRFAPSSASPKLYGRPGGYTESDAYGPACNDAGFPVPTIGCGDPVNPATGNLSLAVVDTIVAGRGPGLALARTYNAQAAAGGPSGRFGVGWSDTYGARLVIGPSTKHTVVLGTGATVPFTAVRGGFTAPTWVTATLTATVNGRYDFTFANQTTLTFDADGRLVWISDLSDEPVLLRYAPDGSLETVADASGRTLTFGYDAVGRVTNVVDPANRSITYAYDTGGNLVTVTDVAGAVTRYTYDGQHRLTGITDPIGATAATTYDEENRVVGQVDPLGNRLALEYTGSFPDQITVVTDGNGHRAAYEYTGGVLVAETAGLGSDVESTTSHLYDNRGALVGTVDPGNNLWQYSWDAAGNLLTTTDPFGRTCSATYDARGNPTSTTSALGITTRIEYDERAQPVRVTHATGTPDEAEVSIARNDPLHPSDVTALLDPLGGVTSFEYDAHGNPVHSFDALGNGTTWAYDVLGQVTSVTDASGATTRLTRSPRGEITSFVDPLGHVSSAAYDANGNVVSMTDPFGQTTTLRTDLAGRSVALELADGTSQSAGRDAVGALLGQTNELGATSTTGYDARGRLTAWTDAVGGTWQVGYDAIGHAAQVTDPMGVVTSYTYDAAGQLTGVSYSDGTPAVSYTYDADGRRTSMTDDTGTSTYEWDARSRLVRQTDGAGHSVTSTYDARGGLIRVVYPDGLTVEHDHDLLGRLTAVRDGLGHENRFSYDVDGRLVESKLGNGVTTDLAYDANGWVASMTSTAPNSTAPFASFAYQRDAGGRPVALTDRAGTRNATFDVRGRLTGLGSDTFTLDAAGNLTGLRGEALSYDIDGRLRFAVGPDLTAYAYDPAGRRVGRLGGIDGPAGYTYDAAGRLTGVQDPGAGVSTSYTYDGDGLRTSAIDASGTTASFAWQHTAAGPMLLDDGTSRFVHGPDGLPLEQIDDTGVATWFHTDQNGDVRALTDATGAVVGTLSWDAYGRETARSGSVSTRLGFHSRYTDAGTGFQYLQSRYYDPRTAQFLTVDPRVIRTHHPYAFAAGNPLSFSDPTGLDPQVVPGADNGVHVLAGHGRWVPKDGYTVVPEGTTVIFHQPAGSSITDEYGRMIEAGQPTDFTQVYGPGSRVPNYTLGAPEALTVLPTSATVSGSMTLSQILQPGMGTVDWAACREPGEGSMSAKWVQDRTGEYVQGNKTQTGHSKAPIWGVNGAIFEDEWLKMNDPGKARDRRTMPIQPDAAWYDWDSGDLLPGA